MVALYNLDLTGGQFDTERIAVRLSPSSITHLVVKVRVDSFENLF